jgi:hypothetical protein
VGQSPTVAGWFWQRGEVILVGDFNRLRPKEGALTSVFPKKCADHGITNPAVVALRSRRGPCLSTCNEEENMKNGLDHVLVTLPTESLRGAGILSGPSWTARADHAPIWGEYCIPRRQQPVKPIWERTERRLQVAIDKRLHETLEEFKSKTLDWLSTAPASPFPLTLEERDSRLEELQTRLRATAETALLRPKKKHAPIWYFFGAFPAPLRLLKMHLHTLVRLWRLLKAPLSGRSYGTGSLRGPRLRRYLYIVAAWRDHAQGLHGDMLEPDRLLNPLDAGSGLVVLCTLGKGNQGQPGPGYPDPKCALQEKISVASQCQHQGPGPEVAPQRAHAYNACLSPREAQVFLSV